MNNERLSRRERRAQMRQQRRNESYDPKRRQLLKYALIGGGLLTSGALTLLLRGEFSAPSDEDLILSEVQRLGIHKSEAEVALWADASADLPRGLPVKGNEQVASDIFSTTAEKMLRSENPHFKAASSDLFDLAQRKTIRFIWLDQARVGQLV